MAMTRKKELAAQTKEHLYQVAIRLFKEKTYQGVTVDDIVREAGSSKGAFYFHFKSKDHIIAYLFSQTDKYYESIANVLENYPTGAEKLLRFVELQTHYSVQTFGTDFIRIIYGSQLINDKIEHVVDNPDRSMFKILSRLVREAQRTGEFRTDYSAEKLVNIIGRSMRALYYDWGLEEYDLEKEGEIYFRDFVIPGLLKQKKKRTSSS